MQTWQAVAILLGVVVVIYLAMWRGWRGRAAKHDLPPLVPAPSVDALPAAKLSGGARYFGTTVAGDWLDRVVARGLGARSQCRLSLSGEGLDVIRLAGSFRIPADALRGARHDQGIAGKVVPPHGLLVVTWQHGEHTLDTGFRLTDTSRPRDEDKGVASVRQAHNAWIRAIGKLTKESSK